MTGPAPGIRDADSLVARLAAEGAPARLFGLFLGLHAAVWILLPTLVLPGVHRDVIELVNWSRHFQWGYWKHPPLQSWVAAASLWLSGGALWGIYLASQVSVSLCLWAVWRLGRDVLSPAHAVAAVLVLEGILYYNYNTPKFNHDALQLPMWAGTVVFFWLALTRGRAGYWLATGVIAGLGVLSKYTVAFLLAPLAVFVLAHPRGRRALATSGPYLALGVFALIIAPHLAWLIANGFSTIVYGLGRAGGQGRVAEHLGHPLNFAFNHALVLIPAGLLVATLWISAHGTRAEVRSDGFARAFLFTAALGPFLTFLVVSAVTGRGLLSGWGTPQWSFLGVFLLHRLSPALTEEGLRRFGGLVLALAVFWPLVFVGQFTLGPALTGKLNPELFPGQAMAALVTRGWRDRYHAPLPVAAGDKWFAEYVGFYSTDHPDVHDLTDPDSRKAPWTSDADVNQRGGVLVWDAQRADEMVPSAWLARFPAAVPQPPAAFPWQTSARVPPVRLGWAVVPPAVQLR